MRHAHRPVPFHAVLLIAGTGYRVEVLRETPQRFLIEWQDRRTIRRGQRGRWFVRGGLHLVRKDAIAMESA